MTADPWQWHSLCLSELWPGAWDAEPGDLVPLYQELRPLGAQSAQFRAVLVCERCPVRLKCLDDAMARDERRCIYGGLMPSQRKALALMLSSVG